MDIEYAANASVTGEEMQALLESVNHGVDRCAERNTAALAGSIFVAVARCDGRLVGLLRLIGDGAYILHVADLEVHPDYQKRGIGRELMRMGIEFARGMGVGAGDNPGEFTLFAAINADRFYEKVGFIVAPNGMVLTDTESRRDAESGYAEQWRANREANGEVR